MSHINIEQGFQKLEESVHSLKKALDTSFFDAYVESVENLLDEGKVRVIDNIPSEKEVEKLSALYQSLLNTELTVEEKRKVTQLTLLKGLKEEPLQPNHQLTPDGIGYLFVYLIEQLLTSKDKPILIGDLAAGMGNLLYTIMANLELAGYKTEGIGVDIDELLLHIAAVNKNYLDLTVSLYHQDGLEHLLIPPLDIAVADLPVGYYPHDTVVKDFMTAVTTEHSYAHHVLMEQSMNYVKEGGFGLFLLPSDFLETEQASALTKWMQTEVYLQAVLHLPSGLFSQKSLGKSIILLQKRGGEAKQAEEVLLAELPSLKESNGIKRFAAQFQSWRQTNLK